MLLEWAGAVTCLIWLYLLLGRGAFWRVDLFAAKSPVEGSPANPPRIVAVIPARNEAPVVGQAIASLVKQNYRGGFHIVLVDDGSEDGTAEAAGAAADPGVLTVLRSAPLPLGWTGKVWAMSQGIEEARRYTPEYLLLTDADIVHPPNGLNALVSEAREGGEGGYDLVSWMVALNCQSLAERALMPAFVFFFFMLYPPAWIRNPRHHTAGAAGGCMLVRREALERMGGIQSIRGELIDDCALARAVKRGTPAANGRIRLDISREARSIREYRSFAGIFRMISRTAFTQLRHSWLLLLMAVLGLTITFLLPPVMAVLGSRLALLGWVFLSLAYCPMLRFYRRSELWAPFLPLVAAFYLAATVHSGWSRWRGAAGMWKGRAQGKLS
jgi:hopene-associated glycosyltransferase HpnB